MTVGTIKEPQMICGALVALYMTSAVPGQESASAGRDWPQWRGPNRDAVCLETGLLKSWPAEGPPLLWKHTGLGGGYSTPSIANGKLFGMSYRGNDEVVWCLDEATRKDTWVTRIAGKGRVSYNEGSRCTPTVEGDRVYVVGVSGDVVCLDAGKGTVVWTKNFKKDFAGRMMSGWGYSESPLVDGERVIVTPGGEEAALVALDKKTGATIWKSAVPDSGGAGYASVMPAEVGGVRMYITWLGGMLVGVSAEDGSLLWKYSQNANQTANIPTVLVKDNIVFCSTGYGSGTAVLKLSYEGGKVKATEVKFHRGRDLQNHHGGMVLVGDHVYMGHGHNAGVPACVEFATGNIAWKPERGVAAGSAAVLYADGHIIFRWQDGTIGLVEANPAEFKLKSTFKQPDRSRAAAWAHPVIANGKMYIRDQDVLLCYEVRAK
jgi:outer membrane protein assembly factor BamB